MNSKPQITIVVATTNNHKLEEIQKLLQKSGIVVMSLSQFPALPEVVENGKTLETNAIKKAEAVMQALCLPALADDSGLFVPSLKGLPGVKSARYAGPARDYAANNRKLLKAMTNLKGPLRKAYFATAMAFAMPKQKTKTKVGKVWGYITTETRGSRGFGYDPLFRPSGFKKTFAEMKLNEKNKISHRALALQKICNVIQNDLVGKLGRE